MHAFVTNSVLITNLIMSTDDLNKCLEVLMGMVSAQQFPKSIFFLKLKYFSI